jgi:hypothetical protein
MRVLHARDSVLVWSVSLGLIDLTCVSSGGLQDVHSLLLTASTTRKLGFYDDMWSLKVRLWSLKVINDHCLVVVSCRYRLRR